MELTLNPERIIRDLEELARFSDTEAPAITRVVFTPTDLRARAWLHGKCRAAGLKVREDAIGNFFARWEGSEPDLPAVGTGSHCDAIPHSGLYDGTVGVLGGLEAIRLLKEAGFQPRRSIEVLMFTSEEPTRFGLGCLGSRLLSGRYTPEQLAHLRDAKGESIDAVRQGAGFMGALESVKLPDDYYADFVELHIEQGPILEETNTDIGAVYAIAAPAALRVIIHGEGGHAGAVLMPVRRDALLGAAELSLKVDEFARSTGRIDTVGTTGFFQVHPGAVNSIPSRCTLEIDVRDTDLITRDGVVAKVRAAAEDIAARRGLRLESSIINADPPAPCAAHLVESVTAAATACGYSVRRMVSRAYHDSLFMAMKFPTAMIFIPCRGGVSHRPDEYSSPEAIAKGVDVLARVLAEASTRSSV